MAVTSLSDVLMEGETREAVASVVALAYHRPGRDRSAPLVVFLPGGGHLARIAYGYPGGERRDFLDYWLELSGYGLLAVSPPSEPPFTPVAPALDRAEWAEIVADLVGRALHAGAAPHAVILVAWSLASGLVGHLALALRARGIEIAAFVPLAAGAPLPRPARSYAAEERVRDDGLWDVAGSSVFGIERATAWLDQIAAIEAELGRSVLPEAAYRSHILVGTPVGLARGGLARTEPSSTEEPDIADLPLAAPLVPMDESDYRHGIGDVAGWTYVNTQIVLARYALTHPAAGETIGAAAWRQLTALVDSLSARLPARLPGGHFFFVGENGARATAAAILDRLAATSEVVGELNDILPPRAPPVAAGSQVRKPRARPDSTKRSAMQSQGSHPVIEMSRTHPPLVPEIFDPEYRAALDGVMSRFSPSEMVGAHRWMGTDADRSAGAAFVARRLGTAPEPGRVVVTNGTQSAFNMLLGGLVGRGEVLAVESLTYPPVLALAERLGFIPRGVAMDGEGMLPDALEALCRQARPKAAYLLSTLQNPTTATMSPARREAIVAVARRHDLQLIEDDIYSLLPADVPRPLAALAPERSWYILGVAKSLAAGMKIAYVVAPSAAEAERQFWPGVRATFWMAAPISAAVSTWLIDDGGADRVIEAVRAEMRERHLLVAPITAGMDTITADGALHVWIRLPRPMLAGNLAARIRAAGVNVATGDPYAPPGESAPQALRVGIGHARSQDELANAMHIIAATYAHDPALAEGALS